MRKIETVKYAVVDKNYRLMKVGSSRRPATFSSLDLAEKWFDSLTKFNSSELHLVEVWSTKYKSFNVN